MCISVIMAMRYNYININFGCGCWPYFLCIPDIFLQFAVGLFFPLEKQKQFVVFTWLLFSARRESSSSLTLKGFPTRTVILWKKRQHLIPTEAEQIQNTSRSKVLRSRSEESRATRLAGRRSNLRRRKRKQSLNGNRLGAETNIQKNIH